MFLEFHSFFAESKSFVFVFGMFLQTWECMVFVASVLFCGYFEGSTGGSCGMFTIVVS